MLTWNVTYHCKPGQRDAFYKALCDLGIRENSIHEEGNLKYDYFFDAQDPDALLLVAGQSQLCRTPTARRRSLPSSRP